MSRRRQISSCWRDEAPTLDHSAGVTTLRFKLTMFLLELPSESACSASGHSRDANPWQAAL